MFIRRAALLAGIALACLNFATAAGAATLRWGGEADAGSMDPYTRNETMQLSLVGNIYEPLVRRGADLALEPALAVAWEQVQPARWRFHLRPGVTWQDGGAFTAADVLFSLRRIQAPTSLLRSVVARIVAASAPDEHTVEFDTDGPDAILPEEITTWYIMSRDWCVRTHAEAPTLLSGDTENHATRDAMGTGPYKLVAREPDRRTDLERNPAWWDTSRHLVDRVEFSVLSAPSTRVAALVAGDVDLITAVPPQDAAYVAGTDGLKLLRGPELRTIFLGMDQARAELLKSSVKGANPFRDRRVREAIALAIDEPAIVAKVLRGAGRPAALLWGPGVNGYDAALDRRDPPDPARARALLAEAGYQAGFAVTMDCPNDRYVMDEAICTALVPMLARIGIALTVDARPKARFFAEIGPPAYHTSFYLLGWSPPTDDALNVLTNLASSRHGAWGAINDGGYANPAVDALIERIGMASDRAARQGLIARAATLLRDDVAYIPLHQQVLLWGAKTSVSVPQSPDGFLYLRLVGLSR